MTKPILELSGTSGVLVFDLSPGSSGKYDFDRAVSAQKLCTVLNDMSDWLRLQVKHHDDDNTAFLAGLSAAKDKLWELINEEGIGELFL